MALPEFLLRRLHQLHRPELSTIRRIARGWLVLGLLTTVLFIVMAVTYYGYGMPAQDMDTGRPMTPEAVAEGLWLIGGSALLFTTAGLLVLHLTRGAGR